ASPAAADTLREALLQAYATNPTITGARAGQRAIDENVPIALSQGRPNLIGTGQYLENVLDTGSDSGTDLDASPRRSVSANLELEFPIYQGGAVRNGVRAAERRVEGGRAELRSTEANLFVDVVTAYMDVISNRNIVELNANQVGVLSTEFQATSDRFEIGDLTRTDVAQAQARLATAQANLETAEADLIATEELYLRLVGERPGVLEPPPPLPALPETPDQAEDVAVEENPNLVSAEREAEAVRRDIDVAEAQRLPRLSAVASGGYNNFLGSLGGAASNQFAQSSASVSVGLRATVPLYQGGEPSARVRQQTANFGRAQEFVIETERAVVANARSAFSRYRAGLDNIQSAQVAVDANTLALEGVRAENSVGLRTIIEVLNAQQELLNSQVSLVTARRNAYVAGFTLLAAMGRAEARDLGLDGGVLYDPVANYERVRGIWSDWDDDPIPPVEATRTVDVPLIGPIDPRAVGSGTPPVVVPTPPATYQNPVTSPPDSGMNRPDGGH
ncbi:MAG: TolC family outer membrane protein, partial [Sphingomonadaceae bacterium]|nr:TolC family outer membrane protein [Sphingomonadaceae bacterium]